MGWNGTAWDSPRSQFADRALARLHADSECSGENPRTTTIMKFLNASLFTTLGLSILAASSASALEKKTAPLMTRWAADGKGPRRRNVAERKCE